MPTRPIQPVYVCGPTAAGKSAFAAELAERVGGEIVNADAFQLYQGLDVLTAAPSPAERTRVPHHLYGVLDPSETMDAGTYLRLARPVIDAIIGRGNIPVVTGGSGLYLKFLTHGPAPLPQADAALRAAMDARHLDDLVAELRALDPVEAARTSLKNRRYVSRALEICLLSGQAASSLRDQWAAQTATVAAALQGYLIQWPRAGLHARIATRTRAMLEGGAIREVAALASPSDTCGKAIGFREIREFLDAGIDHTTCEERINAATRQYAKRQETWFRRETWLTPHHPV